MRRDVMELWMVSIWVFALAAAGGLFGFVG
jgi:hypothetical protein